MGLRDWFRPKPEEDSFLGANVETTSSTVTSTVVHEGDEGVDVAELARRLQDARGDTDEVVAELREMFPDAKITVSEQSGAEPAADPIGQLERLAALHASGALDDAEFAAAKARLLGT